MALYEGNRSKVYIFSGIKKSTIIKPKKGRNTANRDRDPENITP
jgi:hypothetical protein